MALLMIIPIGAKPISSKNFPDGSNIDELVKSQKLDGKVKSSKCKACES